MNRGSLSLLCLIALLCGTLTRAHAVQYRVRYLALPAGLTGGTARAINDGGMIGGYAHDAAGNYHGLLWDTDGSVTDFGMLPGSKTTEVRAITSAGWLVGASYWVYDGPPYVQTRAFAWRRESGFVDLPLPSGAMTSSAYGANDQGVIAGGVSGYYPSTIPALWTLGASTPPVLLSGLTGPAYDVNNRGDVLVDDVVRTPDGILRQLIPLPGYAYSRGARMNNAGQVVGYSYDAGNNSAITLWDADGRPTRLSQDGWSYINVIDINDVGQVVGMYLDGTHGHSFFYDPAAGSQEFTVPGARYVEARGMNNQGIIVGDLEDLATGQYRLAAFEPVPEPCTVLSLLAGLGCLAGRSAKRYLSSKRVA